MQGVWQWRKLSKGRKRMTEEVLTAEIVKYESGLDTENHSALVRKFNPIVEQMPALVKLAHKIKVVDINDVDGMTQAKETRLALRKIRIDAEKLRVDLKAESLKVGRAIDGFANVIKAAIIPAEDHLAEQEKFIEIQEQKRKRELKELRDAELTALGVDVSLMLTGEMLDEAYAQFLEMAKAGYAARLKAAEDARIQAEKDAEAEAKAEAEREKATEIARKKQEEAEKEAAAARKKQEAAEKALRIAKAQADKKLADTKAKAAKGAAARQAEIDKLKKAEEDRKAKEAADKAEADRQEKIEEARLKAEQEAKLSASDKDKLTQLLDDIRHLSMPDMTSERGKKALQGIKDKLNILFSVLRTDIKNM